MGARASKQALVKALLGRYGQTFAGEVRVDIARNTPAPLVQLLNMSLLLSARIASKNAVCATRALIDAGFTTAQKMADASWQERVDVITSHGYKRYDERTATMLGDTAERLLERYRGDLRKLRAEAGRDVARERKLLQQFSGIGTTGADIFLREVQLAWKEAYPYADARVLKSARTLGIGKTPEALQSLVARRDFPRLAAGLVRLDIAKDYDTVREAA